MFDRIAPTYDRLNTVLSFGSDGRWRRAAVRASGVRPGDRVIDVACGSGKLAVELAAAVGPAGRVTGVDLSPGMIEVAQRMQPPLPQLDFIVANALDLPFVDDTFDAATIAFGLRNLADYEAGFRELARVVRPRGRVVCLELSLPRPAWWGRLFHGALPARLAAGRGGGRPEGRLSLFADVARGLSGPRRSGRHDAGGRLR